MKLILASEFCESFEKTRPYIGQLDGKSVLLIETAALGEGWAPDPVKNISPFERHGAAVTSFDLTGKTIDEVAQSIENADIVYVCGGNSFYLLEHMKACGFDGLLRTGFERGLIYIGSSAGAIVTGPDISFIAPMDNPDAGDSNDTGGLGLVDFRFLPHLGHAAMGKAAETVLNTCKNGHDYLFALQDHQALIVQDGSVLIA